MYKLLIVEDEPIVRKGLRMLIDYTRFEINQVYEAENGLEAWQIFEKEEIQIVLTDINMPRMNGITLLSHIKEVKPDTHVIFISGYSEFEYARSALKLGADDYLLKPFSKEDIEVVLQKVMERLRLERKQSTLTDLLEEQSHHPFGELIEQHLSDPQFSLKKMADLLGFSPNHLGKRIKDETGMSFQSYYMQEKMKKAKRLLLTTDMKNAQIALEIGIEDMNYFSYRFKQEVGMSPRQYKKTFGQK